MSKFYLQMTGGKSNSETVTRRGYSGGYSVTASWEGCIETTYYSREGDGKPMARVWRKPWQGSGGPTVLLYDGPFDMSDPAYRTDLSEAPHG